MMPNIMMTPAINVSHHAPINDPPKKAKPTAAISG